MKSMLEQFAASAVFGRDYALAPIIDSGDNFFHSRRYIDGISGFLILIPIIPEIIISLLLVLAVAVKVSEPVTRPVYMRILEAFYASEKGVLAHFSLALTIFAAAASSIIKMFWD